MPSDDVKRVLEAAAASPEKPFDAHAVLNRGARLRRARVAAVAAGVAIVVAGTSATFGLAGFGRDDGGPGVASAEEACRRAVAEAPVYDISVFLRDDATRSEVDALLGVVRGSPGVTNVTYVSKADAYREFKQLYEHNPALWESVPPGALPASIRVDAEGDAELEGVVNAVTGAPGVDEVKHSDPEDGADAAGLCVTEEACRRYLADLPEHDVTVLLRHDATPGEVEALLGDLRESAGVTNATYVSKADAYREIEEIFEDRSDFLQAFSPGDFPALVRVDVDGEDATERVAGRVRGARGVDRVIHGFMDVDARCDAEVRIVQSPEGTDTPSEPVVDVVVTRAECGVQAHYGGIVPTGKWCRFVVRVDNDGESAVDLAVEEQLLHTQEGTLAPWSQAMTEYYPSQLFKGPIPAGGSMLGEVAFLLTKDQEPVRLELRVEQSEAPFVFDLDYDCAPNLHPIPGGKCLFQSAERGTAENPSYPIVTSGPVEVELQSMACNITPLRHGGTVLRATGRWCAVQVMVVNRGDEDVQLDTKQSILTGTSPREVYLPWDEGMRKLIQGQLLTGIVRPGDSETGAVFYDLPRSEAPRTVQLVFEPGGEGVVLRLGTGDCDPAVAARSDAFSCEYDAGH